MDIKDKDRFLEVMKGIPAGFIATAIGHGTGVDWRGSSKSSMFEGLFGIYSHTLSRIPTLEKLRDDAISYQKRAKEATIYNRKIEKERMDSFINKNKILKEKKILQKEILDVLKMGIDLVRFPSEVPFKPDQFVEKAEDIIKKITNYGDKDVCI